MYDDNLNRYYTETVNIMQDPLIDQLIDHIV